MSDVPRPQDATADQPVTEVSEEKEPTPQGRADDPADIDAKEEPGDEA